METIKQKLLFFFILLSTIILSKNLNAQNNQESISDPQKTKPQIKVDVNKEVDEYGNIIRYDSTYSYFYSDSAFNVSSFDSLFNNQLNGFTFEFGDSFFNDMTYPLWDSINKNSNQHFDHFFEDFENNSFFKDYDAIMQEQMEMLDRHMKEMEEMREKYYKKRQTQRVNPQQPTQPQNSPSQPPKKKEVDSEKDVKI